MLNKYPYAAGHLMVVSTRHVADVTETYLVSRETDVRPQVKAKTMQLSGAVARGVWQIVRDLKVKLVCVWSQTGTTARIFSKYRFPVPTIAFSSDLGALRQMALCYGVIPQEMSAPSDMAELVEQVDVLVRDKKFAAQSDRIVIVAGSALGTPGTMDGIIIHTVGQGGARAELTTAMASQLENS